MEVKLYAESPAETRLLAAFLNDLAELQEIEREKARSSFKNIFGEMASSLMQSVHGEAERVVQEVENAERSQAAEEVPSPPKKTRAKKTESAPTAEPAAESGSTETAEPAAEEQPDEAKAEPITRDTLRTLFGELVQAGKRDAAIAAVKSFGYDAIRSIPDDKLAEVHAAMKKVA